MVIYIEEYLEDEIADSERASDEATNVLATGLDYILNVTSYYDVIVSSTWICILLVNTLKHGNNFR